MVLAACGGGDVQENAGEGGAEHSHDGAGAHTHPAADTLASSLALSGGSEGSWSGSTTVLAVGDSLRVLVSIEGASSGSRHPVELVAGSCEDAGPELASLTPVAAGASGKGSSQTTVPTARLDGHAHGAIRVMASDESPAACAPVHLAVEHTHE